jgi:hypothetical protein
MVDLTDAPDGFRYVRDAAPPRKRRRRIFPRFVRSVHLMFRAELPSARPTSVVSWRCWCLPPRVALVSVELKGSSIARSEISSRGTKMTKDLHAAWIPQRNLCSAWFYFILQPA